MTETPAGEAMPEAAGCRILLVEDEPANRALVRAILARSGPDAFVLLEAESLADARAVLATETPDVVLLDVRLPDGNGLDLVPEVRGVPGPRPTIVVMSASVMPADRLSATAAGVDTFIGKPYAASELLDVLHRVCGATRARTLSEAAAGRS
jgi:CheY-like chemotaxis protein